MATRYDGTDGEMDLELSAPTNDNYYDFSSGANGTHGTFEDLYKWATSEVDPVDDYEVNRNNIIYEKYQKNRNPFIDHPEFIQMIYVKNYDGPGALLDNNPHKILSQEEQVIKFTNMVSSIDENNIDSKSLLDEALEFYNSLDTETQTLVESTYNSLLNKIKANEDVIISTIENKINSIGSVTLEDKALIEEIEKLYALLSLEAKAKITNYEEFTSAKETYNSLYESWLLDNPIEAFEYHFGKVTGMAGSGKYLADSTITYENKSFFVSYSYKSGSEFRLGHNQATSAPSKFTSVISGIKSQSASIESLFDITGQKISIDTYNASGTVNNMYLLKSVDNGETYTLVGTSKALTNERITFDITPGLARYAIEIDGSSNPRLGLVSLIVS